MRTVLVHGMGGLTACDFCVGADDVEIMCRNKMLSLCGQQLGDFLVLEKTTVMLICLFL